MLTRFNDSCDGHRVDIAPLLHDSLLRIPLDRVQVVKRHDQFSLFIPQHRKAAGRLLSLFLGTNLIFIVYFLIYYLIIIILIVTSVTLKITISRFKEHRRLDCLRSLRS